MNGRAFSVPDLGIGQTLGSGEQAETSSPDDAETGQYTCQVTVDGETVYEGIFTVQ